MSIFDKTAKDYHRTAKLEDGTIVQYDFLHLFNYEGAVANGEFLGIGVIWEINNIRQYTEAKCKFYRRN